MRSIVLRRIFQKSIVYRTKCIDFCCANSYSYYSSKLGGHRVMSTDNAAQSPWLMLPPVSDGGGGVVYKYYSLAEKKIVSLINNESPADEAEFVGSSHGWVALFNRRNNDLFLSDPISHRHVKLPAIQDLPDRDMNARRGHGNVSKLILSSSSPEDHECRAVITFGPANRLTFCSPAANTGSEIDDPGWIPVGGIADSDSYSRMVDEDTTGVCATVHEDLVFCQKRKKFSTMTPFEFDLDSFDVVGYQHSELYDLDPWNSYPSGQHIRQSCHRLSIGVEEKEKNKRDTLHWLKKNKDLLQGQCVQIPHLVYAEGSDELYIAQRFVMLMNSDGTPLDRVPYCPFRGLGGYFLSKTVGFVLLKFNSRWSDAEIVEDLRGLVMFVGINHSFALPASDFPDLKPDSIYFTDSKRIKRICGRNDIGIFDYRNKTVTEVASSDEIGDLVSSPIWFTPAGCYE